LPAVSSPVAATLVVGALVATIVDIRTRRIPNLLTATMALIGLGLAGTGVSGLTVWAAAAGLVLGLAVMLPGHLLGATGAGDVKLMAAAGALLGPALVLTAFIFAALAGGVLAIAVSVQRQRLAATLTGTGRLVSGGGESRDATRNADASRRFAYGPALAIGCVLAAFIG
jgi:prepilin peptidase CpaA